MTMTIKSAYCVEDNSIMFKVTDIVSSIAPELFMRELARQFAERYLAENYQAIAAQIDQKAIATLSVAEAGAAIRETLEKKLPDKVLEVVRTEKEVWQRGILGGMTRIR